MKNTKQIGNYVVDITPKTINGHYELNLIAGHKYEIRYGIHQGMYEYLGQIIEDKDFPQDAVGQYYFKSCDKDIEFAFYGDISPFEFTRIVRK